ncbi:MAG: NUDIX hydrolase [Chloroflexota bacterium]
MGYCYRCGSGLSWSVIESIAREVCPDCGWVHYPQLKVSAAALVTQHDALLLVQRGNDPWRGCWYLPAGYVEADENPARAAERELREETGLAAVTKDLAGVYFFDDDPRGNGVLIVFRCELNGGMLNPGAEVRQAGYFQAENLPAPLTGAGHDRAIYDWIASQRKRIE